jgi:hypothetical protein
MVPLVGVLRYTHRHEIAVGESSHAAEPFAGRSAESLTVVLGGRQVWRDAQCEGLIPYGRLGFNGWAVEPIS